MSTKVLISGALHANAVTAFKNNKQLKVVYKPDLTKDELYKEIADAQVLVSRSETNVDKPLIDAAKNLKVIARAAVGVGNIDVPYATERGILVINCPGKNTNSAAELTLGLILAVLRNINTGASHVQKGGWDRHKFAGLELRGKKIGIVGLGNVGHRVAQFAHGFDMEVYAYDPYIAPAVFARHKARQTSSLAELASQVDILSMHVPLTKETSKMLNKDILAKLPKNAYVINAARGEVVAEEDILAALNSGHIAGYGVDTFQNEPKPNPALVGHPKVVPTPHIGASTEEAQLAIGATVYDQVVKAVEGGVVDYPVNLPEVGIPDDPLVKSYSVLAQKLGSMIGQILDFNPKRFTVSYRGNIAGLDTRLVKLGLMKGYASQVVDDYVSFVNAGAHFEKLGIQVAETQDPDFESYKSALKVIVDGGSEDQRLTIGGIVFDDRYLRISLLNGFTFELVPDGAMLLMENHDRPGVIGAVGQFLADHQVNIDHFALSRNKPGGKAMAVIRIDYEDPKKLVPGLLKIPNVVSVKSVRL